MRVLLKSIDVYPISAHAVRRKKLSSQKDGWNCRFLMAPGMLKKQNKLFFAAIPGLPGLPGCYHSVT